MSFRLIPAPHAPPADPVAAELALLERASEPLAQLWQAPRSLVVPRSYRRHAGFDALCADFAAAGWPVHVRPSGGGLVPQGPGIINLSLAYTVPGSPGRWSEPIYRHLCRLIQASLRALGVETQWQHVPGSFCDGRFNLACGDGAHARKIAGTAQYWRLLPAAPGAAPRGYAVLAHALVLVDPDLDAMHQRANAFERALGSGRHYDPGRTTSLARELGDDPPRPLLAALERQLRTALASASPPAGH